YEYGRDGTDEQRQEVGRLPGYKQPKSKVPQYRFFPFVGLIFPETTKSNRSRYASVLRFADDQGITPDGLAAFIAEHGGIAKIAQSQRNGSAPEPPKSNPKLDEAVVRAEKILCGIEGDNPEYIRALLKLTDDGCYRF